MVTTRRFLFLLLLFLLLCNACKSEPYKKFIPEDGSQFKISFEYPSDWTFENYRGEGYETLLVTRPSNYLLLLSNLLHVDVSVDGLGLLPAKEAIQDQLSAIRSVPERRGKGFKTLSERELMIGGMESYEIVTWIEQYKGKIPSLNIISTDIFIRDEDRYYHFVIYIYIYEADTGKTFSQEVDHLLESIEKVP
jgi:hypothetical protein